jgi:hypothetical protein
MPMINWSQRFAAGAAAGAPAEDALCMLVPPSILGFAGKRLAKPTRGAALIKST